MSLFQSTLRILQKGQKTPVNRGELISQRQAHSHSILKDSLFDIPRIEALWEGFGEEYFLQYQAAEIARHTEFILANEDTPGPLISLRHSVSRGSMEITIYTLDNQALFALIATVLEQLQLNVLSANIHTTAAGYAFDTFYVLESDGNFIEDSHRVEEIRLALQHELGVPHDIPALGAQRASRRLKHFSIPTIVEFDDNNYSDMTEVRVTAADRPGILSSIGRLFLRANVSVHAARISTLGERIDDVFYVTNAHGKPLISDTERQQLRDMLRERV